MYNPRKNSVNCLPASYRQASCVLHSASYKVAGTVFRALIVHVVAKGGTFHPPGVFGRWRVARATNSVLPSKKWEENCQ